jgi:hypothetical protein
MEFIWLKPRDEVKLAGCKLRVSGKSRIWGMSDWEAELAPRIKNLWRFCVLLPSSTQNP